MRNIAKSRTSAPKCLALFLNRLYTLRKEQFTLSEYDTSGRIKSKMLQCLLCTPCSSVCLGVRRSFVLFQNFIASSVLYSLLASFQLGLLSTLKMNAVGSFETPVKIYQILRRNIQKIVLFPTYHVHANETLKMYFF
jgi:hypothetical protein